MTDKQEAEAPTLQFHFTRSNFFRVILVEGVAGGVTPQGFIQAALYNERATIPARMTFPVNADTTLGPEIEEDRVTSGGMTREVEAELMMTLNSARAFRDWLSDRIREAEGIQSTPLER